MSSIPENLKENEGSNMINRNHFAIQLATNLRVTTSLYLRYFNY